MRDKVTGAKLRAARNGCPACSFGKAPEYSPYALYRHSDGQVTDRYGTEHTCDSPAPRRYPAAATAQPEPVQPEPAKATDDKLAALTTLLNSLVSAPKLDTDTVTSIVKAELARLTLPAVVEVRKPDSEPVRINGAHKSLPTILAILNAGQNAMLWGQAGVGKSTLASQAAKALTLAFHSLSFSPQTPVSSLVGYMDAQGRYVSTGFRKAFESGGIFLGDEADLANPATLAVLNSALSNGSAGFPDGEVKRHPDFRMVLTANTTGRGADRVYVGRNALDGASLDRFSILEIGVDDALERAMCHATGLSVDRADKVLAYVRQLRQRAADSRMAVLFTPRGSEGACKLLAAGLAWREVLAMRIRHGISDSDWAKLTAGLTTPAI